MIYILGIIAYFLIGGLIYGCVDNPELENFCRFGWPIVIILAMVYYLGEAGKWLGDRLRETWQNLINPEVEEEV